MRRIRVIAVLLLSISLAGCPRGEPAVTPPPPTTSGGEQAVDAAPDHAVTGGNETTSNGSDSEAGDEGNTGGSKSADKLSPERAWLAKLGSDDRDELKAATEHFASLDDGVLPMLIEHRNDPDDDVRRGATFGLYGRFDPSDSQLVSAMEEALGDSDTGVRHIALEAINKLPKKAFANVIPQLARRLDDANEPEAELRAKIARMIARQKTAAQAALPALNQAVREDADFNVRSACLFAIYNVARDADEALPAPMHVLTSDRDPRLRRIAAERLGKYGAAAAPAVPQLVAALGDNGVPARAADDPLRGTDEPVCLAAVAALIQIGKPAVEPLVREITSENRIVRVLAIRAIGDIGPAAAAAVPALEQAATSTDPAESAAAKSALAKIHGQG